MTYLVVLFKAFINDDREFCTAEYDLIATVIFFALFENRNKVWDDRFFVSSLDPVNDGLHQVLRFLSGHIRLYATRSEAFLIELCLDAAYPS